MAKAKRTTTRIQRIDVRVQAVGGPWTCILCDHGDRSYCFGILACGEEGSVVICDECLALGEAEIKDRLRHAAAAYRKSLKRRIKYAVAGLLAELEWKEALPDRLSALPTLDAVRRARDFEVWIDFLQDERRDAYELDAALLNDDAATAAVIRCKEPQPWWGIGRSRSEEGDCPNEMPSR